MFRVICNTVCACPCDFLELTSCADVSPDLSCQVIMHDDLHFTTQRTDICTVREIMTTYYPYIKRSGGGKGLNGAMREILEQFSSSLEFTICADVPPDLSCQKSLHDVRYLRCSTRQ